MEKPPTQSVGVSGFESHEGMAAAPEGGIAYHTPQQALHAGSKDPGFQSFIYTKSSTAGPATPSGTVEAVFKMTGANCWSDLSQEGPTQIFRQLCDEYFAIQTAETPQPPTADPSA